jgi:hypothetical protein
MHYDLGKERYLVDDSLAGAGGLVDSGARGDIVRVGVNLHLNPVREPAPLK